MRQAVLVSRIREGTKREMIYAQETRPEVSRILEDGKNMRVAWTEALYLATRGGKKSLGMGGCLEVGMEFDAQMSRSVADPAVHRIDDSS